MKRGDRVRFAKLKVTVGGKEYPIEPDRELERSLNQMLEDGPVLDTKSLNPDGAYLEKDEVTVVIPPTGSAGVPVAHKLKDSAGRALVPERFRIVKQVGSGSIWWTDGSPPTSERVVFAGSSTGGATFIVVLYRKE
jgi:hypothetical protein